MTPEREATIRETVKTSRGDCLPWPWWWLGVAEDLIDEIDRLRIAAKNVVESFGGAIPGVDPGAFYEAWWKRMNEAVGKLNEAVGEIK